MQQQKEEKADQSVTVSKNKINREKQKSFDKEFRKIKTLVEKCESHIELLESEIKRKEEILGNPDHYREQMKAENVFEKYGILKKELEAEVERWEQLSGELEGMKP